MISEPELVGGADFDGREVLTEADPPPSAPRDRSRRPWAWALAGALVASALWGGGLYGYGRWSDGREEEAADLGGYGVVENLCERAGLKALGTVLGKRSGAGSSPSLDEPALAQSSCSVTFGEGAREQGVEVVYTLHKVTDPGPEFGALAKHYGPAKSVGGVGEEAYFADHGEDGGRMWVLDGQAVLELSTYHSYYEDENGKAVEQGVPDLSGIDVPMTQDALALLAELRK
ncbi:hypothetical protein ACIQRS_03040 [Streptomyces termitum]|uniref:Uncharacterized protein n=1 Tax=Streptomyces termitum TaxID=67368 RepID=A0A918SVI0_9ACTN|nr:hypothetical protein [Streptomyces termitum]GHA72087.1 hypothetical protein GCM10010305_12910 [Streptomyces termitum]